MCLDCCKQACEVGTIKVHPLGECLLPESYPSKRTMSHTELTPEKKSKHKKTPDSRKHNKNPKHRALLIPPGSSATQHRSSPSEAALSNLEASGASSSLDATSREGSHKVWTNEAIQELNRENMKSLAGTSLDPEPFLRPETKSGQAYMDRTVNPGKILEYMINYLNKYYDLNADPDPQSESRRLMDESFWGNMAYIIPLLCGQVVEECFSKETIVTSTSAPAIVFGDIHGNLTDIWYIHRNVVNNKKYEAYKIVFLGDYVDRGPKPLEILVYLFSLKLVDPKRIVILRGNHEVAKVNKKYGFRCLVKQVYEDIFFVNSDVLHKLIYNSVNDAFNNLPVGTVIKAKDKKGVFCCHGGVPSEYLRGDKRPWKLSEINDFQPAFKPHNLIPRKKSSVGQSVLNEILWNDPIPIKVWRKMKSNSGRYFYKNKKRGGHCSWFTEEAANRFLEANNLRLIIRGHQFKLTKNDGYAFNWEDKQMVTVFSSSNYCGTESNVTGCVVINEDGQIKPMVLRSLDESKDYRSFNSLELVMDENKKVIGVIM